MYIFTVKYYYYVSTIVYYCLKDFDLSFVASVFNYLRSNLNQLQIINNFNQLSKRQKH